MFIFSGKAKRFSLQSSPRPTFVGRGLISGLLEKVRTFYQQNPDVGGQKFLPLDPLPFCPPAGGEEFFGGGLLNLSYSFI